MRSQVLLVGLLSILVAVVWMGCRDNSSSPVTTTAEINGPELAKGGGDTGGTEISSNIGIAGSMSCKTYATGCSNNPGPYITVEGVLRLGGVRGRLIFRNNEKGTHEHVEDIVADVVILPEGKEIKFNKQPPLGGVGGNPKMWIRLLNHKGFPMTDEVYIGRCVQGLNPANFDFHLLTKAIVALAGTCSNNPGPFITLDGKLAMGGVDAEIIFRNNDKGTHERIEEARVKVSVLPYGDEIKFAKQPPLGGVGGNPRIYFVWTDHKGYALSKEYYIGRCVQLGK